MLVGPNNNNSMPCIYFSHLLASGWYFIAAPNDIHAMYKWYLLWLSSLFPANDMLHDAAYVDRKVCVTTCIQRSKTQKKNEIVMFLQHIYVSNYNCTACYVMCALQSYLFCPHVRASVDFATGKTVFFS